MVLKKLFAFILSVLLVFSFCGCKPEDEKSETDDKFYIIFTVDVEDKCGNEPNLIEGDLSSYGVEENCGVDYIMDEFDKYNSKAVFFVNVYEQSLYDADYMSSLLKRIDNRGFEVGLHTHQPRDTSVADYTGNLTDLTAEQQYNVLKWGTDYIENAIGKKPVSYRSGSYRVNRDTLDALDMLGYKLDSSFYPGNTDNVIDIEYDDRIQVLDNGIVEVPIVSVFDIHGWRKMDINSLTGEDIIKTIDYMYESESYNVAQIMFHSFSFLDVSGKGETIIDEEDKKISGESTACKQSLDTVLRYIANSDKYEIITFEEYLKLNLPVPESDKDGIIYLGDKRLAFTADNITASCSGGTVYINNDFKSNGDVLYRYRIFNAADSAEEYLSDYSESGEAQLTISDTSDGTYNLTAYMYESDNVENYAALVCYKLKVKEGNIVSIEEK